MEMKLANRLAELRKQHGYTQEDLADKLNISRQAISKWETGESAPDTNNLIALAELYGITLDELIKGNNEYVDTKPEDVVDKKHHYEHKKLPKAIVIINSVEASLMLLTLIAYIVLGATLGLWGKAWCLFFVPEILSSFARAIEKRRFCEFSIVFAVLFTYFFICCWLCNFSMFHPLWVLFLIIPIYYIAFGNIDKAIHSEQ